MLESSQLATVEAAILGVVDTAEHVIVKRAGGGPVVLNVKRAKHLRVESRRIALFFS